MSITIMIAQGFRNKFRIFRMTCGPAALLGAIHFTLSSSGLNAETDRLLYHLNKGNLKGAFELYDAHREKLGKHDLELMQQMGLAILNEGFRSQDGEAGLLTLFGAGISGNEKAIYILEEGIRSSNPQLQLIAINLLARFQNDRATELINSAMSSPFLPIRLEAAFQLAKNKSPKASGQIQALMQKVQPEALQVFPQLLALSGDRNSITSMKRLLSHPEVKVRIEAVLAAAKYGRDDMLPEIRRISTHFNIGEQEAAAVAIGSLKDEASSDRLAELARSNHPTVKAAALYALYQLGREEMRSEIVALCLQGNLFAIDLLGNIPGSEPVLCQLQNSSDINVRINAALSLLNLRDPRCLSGIAEILIKDKRDLAFTKQNSFGKGLSFWKAVPSARQNLANNPVGLELSLHMREEVLTLAMQLPEADFLSLANLIFERGQNDLVPHLAQLLTNLQTSDAIALLKIYREKIGSPLIRNYSNLALFRIKEEGPYANTLRDFVAGNINRELIQLRPIIPWELRGQENSIYQLTPEDASRLLVESFEALVQTQDEQSVDILLQAIRSSGSNNRFALAGLLMRAAH